MPKIAAPPSTTACFATTVPGLEELAAAELAEKLGAEIKKQADGLVVFRIEDATPELLKLRLVEDVFLLAWGSDSLTYKAADLKKIGAWTAKLPKWKRLLEIHARLRPKVKGRPTFHLVTQMRGEHGYRRADAAKAFRHALLPHLPPTWGEKDEGAFLEVWLTIHGRQAICGVRLSDKTLRHRNYKEEHLPASLRPVVAAALVHLSGALPGDLVIDPLCGAGTVLGEQLLEDWKVRVVGGDAEMNALRAAQVNLGNLVREPALVKWDATELPLRSHSVRFLVTNPPFGRQIGESAEIGKFYAELVDEFDRVLAPAGKAVVLVGDDKAFQRAAFKKGWQQEHRLRLRLLGHPCYILAWRKA